MTREEISEFMSAQGCMPMSTVIADRDYQHPAENWFFGSFATALRLLFTQLGLANWRPEENDCDDFARLAASYAQILHTRTAQKRAGTGLAVGEFWYQRDSGGGHAINCTILYDGEYSLAFFEPQTQRRVRLSKQEVESCAAYRF